ncbi:hypothetical protein AVEN_266064-1 [Araneus ventricosus]|uniref:Integrase catalytic domain-containing protein n=1 Tax=Araneus ventricosus TaxID=182803 RepID=A0A4Y2BPY0_ARAVE|nr:hypothetical protein AVEN_266064-1 [Araneus ventricosus]
METDISVKVIKDAWSSSEIQKAQLLTPQYTPEHRARAGPCRKQIVQTTQLENLAIRPILEKKLNSENRPSWQDSAPENSATKRYWALWDSLHLKDGVLYRKWASDDGRSCRCDLILPKSRIKEVLRETHDSASRGHFEVMKTLSKTRDSLQRYNVGEPLERMALDILGPFPVTTKGNRYVLVLMNYFTKWPGAIPITDQEVSSVAEELVRTWISRYVVPIILHSDQGTNFNSTLFTELGRLLGILKTRTTALHPESDGMIERIN